MNNSVPAFSVVVPTRARPRRLAGCLEALAGLDYPPGRYEVVVVDDGSDSAAPVVEAARCKAPLRLVRQKSAGPAAARNKGAGVAAGEYLAFTDDDCAPATDWLRALAGRFRTSPEAAVGGRTINALPENVYAVATQLLIDYLYAYYAADGAKYRRFFASNNLAVSRALFLSVGGFDRTFRFAAGEDREFCARWLAGGHELVFAEDALVQHAHELSLRRFWRQHFNYGRGAFLFHRARAQNAAFVGVRPEPLAFYRGLIGLPFLGRPWQDRAVRLALLLLLSQTANALGFFWEAAAAGDHDEERHDQTAR